MQIARIGHILSELCLLEYKKERKKEGKKKEKEEEQQQQSQAFQVILPRL